jgi:Putative transposase
VKCVAHTSIPSSPFSAHSAFFFAPLPFRPAAIAALGISWR